MQYFFPSKISLLYFPFTFTIVTVNNPFLKWKKHLENGHDFLFVSAFAYVENLYKLYNINIFIHHCMFLENADAFSFYLSYYFASATVCLATANGYFSWML